jgi:hypothetical protein
MNTDSETDSDSEPAAAAATIRLGGAHESRWEAQKVIALACFSLLVPPAPRRRRKARERMNESWQVNGFQILSCAV